MPPIDTTEIDRIIERLGSTQAQSLAILQAIQQQYGYLPTEAIEDVCRRTGIRHADIWGVATFYDQFRLTPAGKHTIRVCVGTACHVKGAEKISTSLRRELNLGPQEVIGLEVVTEYPQNSQKVIAMDRLAGPQ